jgi:Fe-S cluster assembly protein SufB
MNEQKDKKQKAGFSVPKGLTRKTVEAISHYKSEPEWMLKYRLEAFEVFEGLPMPTWGPDLSDIDFNDFNYFVTHSDDKYNKWEDIPLEIKETYEKIGIPQAEQKLLAGVEAQYDSEVIYGNLKNKWEEKGVIFTDTDTALKKYPDLFKEHFGTLVPPKDHKFAALNAAVWSGGSFVYVPPGVEVEIPLQAYFRINTINLGQFERTLIIADEGSYVHYVEGCSAPIYTTDSLHAATTEIITKRGARARYTTVQNWSKNVYNLVTKRMAVHEDAIGEFIDASIGSKVTMKYPSVVLMGRGARGDVLSMAVGSQGQTQDTGGKAIHLAPHTTSTITSKSVSSFGGNATFRGLVKIVEGARGSKSNMRCDSLILDDSCNTDTHPSAIIREKDTSFEHEATVSKIGEEKLFYLMSRGIDEIQATSLIVNGFIEPIVKELPLEYAVELNRLVNLELEAHH